MCQHHLQDGMEQHGLSGGAGVREDGVSDVGKVSTSMYAASSHVQEFAVQHTRHALCSTVVCLSLPAVSSTLLRMQSVTETTCTAGCALADMCYKKFVSKTSLCNPIIWGSRVLLLLVTSRKQRHTPEGVVWMLRW